MKKLYTFLLILMLPLALLRLVYKSLKNPAYRMHLHERLARRFPEAPKGALHFHCVSVGEFLSLRPLLEELLAKYPKERLLLTCTTPTGRAQIEAFAKAYPKTVYYCYLPYDLPCFVRHFFAHYAPRALILMETEIWPNLLQEAQKKRLPTLLINARLSRKSLRAYYRFARPLRCILKDLTINAQSRLDAVRFRKLCRASVIEITPSLKWAIAPKKSQKPQNLKEFLPKTDQRWIAASTHAGEEEAVIQCHKILQQYFPKLQLCIAPRHPERAPAIKKLIERNGYIARLRSQGEKQKNAREIALLDSLGELNAAYGCADLAFIGGSLVPRGGHNPIEALQAGIPIFFGPSMYNFQSIVQTLLREPFVKQCPERALVETALALLEQKHKDIEKFCEEKSANVLQQHLLFLEKQLSL